MSRNRLTAGLPACIKWGALLLASAGVLGLSACGGGSGAPNNPYEPGPTTPGPLSVIPEEAVAFAGTPLVLSITGGTPPYQAFSSNPSALPVPQNVSGSTLALLANNVGANETAIVTIRDAAGVTDTATVSVRPAVLLPGSITIVPNSTPCSTGDVCSGQTSVVSLRVTGPTGSGLAGRSVRFDVVQGQFSLQTTNPASPLAQTQTVVSDANGEARVVIAVAPNTPTQIGLLRATDLAAGGQTTFQFVIAQETAGEGVLSVAPSGATTITGPAQNVCSAGVRVSYYIFGGTPPYRVVVNFPDSVNLVGNPVTTNGGGFDIITNGSCFANLSFAITDATGRTLTQNLPTVTNNPGTFVPPPPTPPPPLLIAPTSVNVSGTCTSLRSYDFVVTGGTPPYSVVTAPVFMVTNTLGEPYAGGNTFRVRGAGSATVSVADRSGQLQSAMITCTEPTP